MRFVGLNSPHLSTNPPHFSVSFTFPVNLEAISFGDIFEYSNDELRSLLYFAGDSDRVFFVSEVDESRVNKCVVDVFVTQHFHDMENILGFVVFHCDLTVA
jgi:hypothetical protein